MRCSGFLQRTPYTLRLFHRTEATVWEANAAISACTAMAYLLAWSPAPCSWILDKSPVRHADQVRWVTLYYHIQRGTAAGMRRPHVVGMRLTQMRLIIAIFFYSGSVYWALGNPARSYSHLPCQCHRRFIPLIPPGSSSWWARPDLYDGAPCRRRHQRIGRF